MIGMVLVDMKAKPKAAEGFLAEISLYGNQEQQAIIWENHQPVVTSQTTHQTCSILFDSIPKEEIKESDLSKLKLICENLHDSKIIKHKKKKSDETNMEFEESKIITEKLSLPALGRQKSKSQDDKLILSISSRDRSSSESDSPTKGKSLSRRKIANMNLFLSTNDLNDLSCKNMVKSDTTLNHNHHKKHKISVDMTKSETNILENGIIQNQKKLTFEEKIKLIKKDIYMFAEDTQPRKKKNMKFVILDSNKFLTLKFIFKYRPEYVTKGQKIIIHDSSMKAIGTVKEVFYVNGV